MNLNPHFTPSSPSSFGQAWTKASLGTESETGVLKRWRMYQKLLSDFSIILFYRNIFWTS
jgi:hypothetical protein